MVAAHEVQLHTPRRTRPQRLERLGVADEDGLEAGQGLVLAEPGQLERVTDEDNMLLRTRRLEHFAAQEIGQHLAWAPRVVLRHAQVEVAEEPPPGHATHVSNSSRRGRKRIRYIAQMTATALPLRSLGRAVCPVAGPACRTSRVTRVTSRAAAASSPAILMIMTRPPAVPVQCTRG